MTKTRCPECGEEITFDTNPDIGLRTECRGCQTFLEVIWLFPLSLEPSEDQSNSVSHNSNKEEQKSDE